MTYGWHEASRTRSTAPRTIAAVREITRFHGPRNRGAPMSRHSAHHRRWRRLRGRKLKANPIV